VNESAIKSLDSAFGQAPRTRSFLPDLGGFGAGVLFLAPLAMYLQWALPGDGPYEYLVTLLSLPLLFLAAALLLLRALPSGVRRFGVSAFLAFFVLLQLWVYVPQVSRRVGQWRNLRSMLVSQSVQVEAALRQQSIPTDRPISRSEIALVEQQLFTPRPTFRFDFPPKEVTIRILLAEPPYVGVDYGGGRNCVFDLESMVATYCD
jgi:hypothetical protein